MPVPQQHPELPLDYTLAIYRHDSLRASDDHIKMKGDFGNVDRLDYLGEKVIDLALTTHFFNQTPLMTRDEMEARRKSIMSKENLELWRGAFDLKDKMITRSDDKSELDDTMEVQKFFNRLVGALYKHHGHTVATNFVIGLVDPDVELDDRPASPPPQPRQASVTPQPPTPSRGASVAPTSSVSSSNVTLAMVNQKASQLGLHVTYPSESTGPSHMPTWTVRCCMSGVEKGVGVGRSQKAAKETAARRAWDVMKW